MPEVSCPAPGCSYTTPDVDAAVVVALLQIHAVSHQPTAAPPPGPKLTRPRIDVGVDQETWNTFVRRWEAFRIGSYINDATASTHLFQCASETLGDILLKADPGVTSRSAVEVLEAMQRYAVIPVAKGVTRAELMQMTQGPDELFRTFAARVKGKAETCGFVTSTACSCGKTFHVDYTTETIRDVLLSGICDTDIRREALSQQDLQSKSINEVISFVEGREMARNATPAASSVSAVKRDQPQIPSKTASCQNCGKTFNPFKEKKSGGWNSKPHKLCLDCWRSSRRRPASVRQDQNSGPAVSVIEASQIQQISAIENTSDHPRVDFSLRVVAAHSPSDIIRVSGIADTGAQSNLWGLDDFRKSGLSKDILRKSDVQIKSVDRSSMNIVGYFEAEISGISPDGDIIGTSCTIYVSPNVVGFYLSYETMIKLRIVDRHFPMIGSQSQISARPPKLQQVKDPKFVRAINKGCIDPSAGASCNCPQRTTVPEKPAKLPFHPIPENNDKMRQWLLERYGGSTFNTCPHRALPCMSGPPVEIHLNESVTPRTCHTPAPVPMHWQERVRDDLIRDEALGVIEKVPYGEPVSWCHRMVVTRKHDGTPRRTVDLSPLNKFCKRETFAAESPFKLARRIPRNTWKTVTDAWNGYHSVPLRESDRHLTTFITPFGRYRYTRAPQGFLSSGDGYNRRFDAILSNFQRKERCVDDTVHYDDIESLEQHWWRTIEFLSTTGSAGVVLNPDKFQFAQRTVEWAGFRISDESIEPLPKYLDAIRTFPRPKSTTDIRSWFGLVNQVSNYAQLRDIMAPFKPFLSPKYKFFWTPVLDKAFNDSKEAIVEAIRKGVEIFDLTKPTCLRPDWSARGVGYFLMQQHCSCSVGMPNCCPDGWKITLAGSRFLAGAEQRYAPIEGEALAIAWGLEQTRYFTQGCHDLLVVTDHKPLAKVFGDRTLDEIPNTRLFRLKQRTLPWSFRIAYLPGKTNHAADATSRNPSPSPAAEVPTLSDEDYSEEVFVNTITRETEQITAISWSMIAEATLKDPILSALSTAIREEFTGEYPLINAYTRYRESLYMLDGVILYNDRVVVPTSLRKAVLEVLHSAHQGVSSMQLRAQSIIFWPGLTRDIERVRENCRECNRNAPSQAPLPSEPAVPPSTPFEQIFADFFEFGGHHYLVTGDRLSGWPEIFSTPCGSSQAGARGLIACLRKFFDTFGVPEELSSDGGPEFTAGITREFLDKWGVKHRVSSAYNPQSNGRAEVAVKSAKRLLRSNIGPTGSLDNDKLLRALLQLRNTPDPDCNVSPAQIIYGRPIRDAFGFANRLEKYSNPHIHPIWREAWESKESALRTRFTKSSEKLNQHSRNLPPLKTGERCLIQNQHGNAPKRWERTGTVMQNLPNDQHIVKVDGSGRLTTRNRRYLRKFKPASPIVEFASPAVPSSVVESPIVSGKVISESLECDTGANITISPHEEVENTETTVDVAIPPDTVDTVSDMAVPEVKIPSKNTILKRLGSYNNPGEKEAMLAPGRGGRRSRNMDLGGM